MNVPSYTTTRFSFGPGILYMGAPGTTPTIDVGAVKGDAEFSLERKILEVKQGSPKSTVKQYAVEENLTVKVTGLEWNVNNLAYCIGAGVTTLGDPEEILEFGGEMTINDRALRFVHTLPTGGTIDIHVFQAQSNGKVSLSFKGEDMHEFPYEFKALVASTDFEGAALASNKRLFKIIHCKA